MARHLYQSQYILQKCFENKENVIRVSLNNAQDYLNAVYDPSKDALRVNMAGGSLPMVDNVDNLPSHASDGQICPVYNSEKNVIDFYEWVDATGEWEYRGSTLNGNAMDDDEKEALEWMTDHIDQLREVIDYSYIVNVDDIILDPNSHVLEVQGKEQDIDDDLDGDGDGTTPFRIDISGYVLSVSTYADANAPIADRYYTRITYEAGTGGLGTSHVFMGQEEYEFFAGLPEGKNIVRVYYLTNATTSPIRRKRLTLNPDGTATDEEGENYAILDDGDTDGDPDTPYRISVGGYVVGVEMFETEQALVPVKFYAKIMYESNGTQSGRSHIYLEQNEFDACAGFANGKNVLDIFYIHTVFPASVTISESQYQFPEGSMQYVSIDPSGNVRSIADVGDIDGEQATHVRMTVNGYAVDMDGYYSENDKVKHHYVEVKMSYDTRSDTTDIFLTKEHYDYVCSLGNGRNVVSVYTIGAGIGVDASRFGGGGSSTAAKVHIWKGTKNSIAELNEVQYAQNGDTYQIGDREYSWNGYEWVELGYNTSVASRETPITHFNGATLNAEAGYCYLWTVPDNVTGNIYFNGTPDTMSTTYVDIDMRGLSPTMSTVAGVNVEIREYIALTGGKLYKCRIEFDGTTPRLYVYDTID